MYHHHRSVILEEALLVAMSLDVKKLKKLAKTAQVEQQARQRAAAERDRVIAQEAAEQRERERKQQKEAESQRLEQKRRRDSIWIAILRAALKKEASAFIGGAGPGEREFLELLRLRFLVVDAGPLTPLYTNMQGGAGCVVYLDGVERLVHTVDGYSLKWIRWLCSQRGHSFFARISENLTQSAQGGQSYQTFLGMKSSLRPAPTASWETYREDRDGNGPWMPYTYYVGDFCIASRGPDPETFRMLLEILDFKGVSQKAVDGTAVKVSWT